MGGGGCLEYFFRGTQTNRHTPPAVCAKEASPKCGGGWLVRLKSAAAAAPGSFVAAATTRASWPEGAWGGAWAAGASAAAPTERVSAAVEATWALAQLLLLLLLPGVQVPGEEGAPRQGRPSSQVCRGGPESRPPAAGPASSPAGRTRPALMGGGGGRGSP